MFVPPRQGKKKGKAKKGSVTVTVGLENEEGRGLQQFVVPIDDLCHPLFKDLLEKAEEVYGCQTKGLLRLPCSVDEFLDIQHRIEQESYAAQAQFQQAQVRCLA